MKIKSVILAIFMLSSFMGCASKKSQVESGGLDPSSPQMPAPISVGTVEAVFEMVSIENSNLSAKVREVIGYGATTPRLAIGQTLSLEVQESVSESLSKLKPGDTFSAVISKSTQAMSGSAGQSWKIVELIAN